MRILEAIEAVAAEYRRLMATKRAENGSATLVLETLASIVRERGGAEAQELCASIRNRLLPTDPLKLEWNVFRLFNLEYNEPRWTQWLANLLRVDSGGTCARIAWKAFGAAVANSLEARGATAQDGMELATAADWRGAADQEPNVESEVYEHGLGRVDMVIEAGPLLAIVENKIREGWHDREGAPPQHECYRRFLRRRMAQRSPNDKGSLIVLGWREDFGEQVPGDYVFVTWRNLAQWLRVELRAEDISLTAIRSLELYPLFLTLVSLEQDLFGFPCLAETKHFGWRDLPVLQGVLDYLAEVEHAS